jgi:hypothetical protein
MRSLKKEAGQSDYDDALITGISLAAHSGDPEQRE